MFNFIACKSFPIRAHNLYCPGRPVSINCKQNSEKVNFLKLWSSNIHVKNQVIKTTKLFVNPNLFHSKFEAQQNNVCPQLYLLIMFSYLNYLPWHVHNTSGSPPQKSPKTVTSRGTHRNITKIYPTSLSVLFVFSLQFPLPLVVF